MNISRKDILLAVGGAIAAGAATWLAVRQWTRANGESPLQSLRSPMRSSISERTVWITDGGSKYHRGDCPAIQSSESSPISIDEAVVGYEPCKLCNPSSI